jgi:hypothetical protein
MNSRRFMLPLLVLAACGGGADAPPDAAQIDECPTTGRYMELATGSSWTYQVDDGGGTETKTQTVGPLEDVGGAKAGVTAFRMTTTRSAGEVVSWQEDTGTAILRHREQDLAGTTTTDEIYEPHKTRLDESPDHLVAGATWAEDYSEEITATDTSTVPPTVTTDTVAKRDNWEVVAVDEVVVVPAGAFCTLHLKRTSTANGAGGSVKHYYFARGVGKVREAGGNQTEELSDYALAQ